MDKKLHFRAVRMLLATTVFWALSFPIAKALNMLGAKLLPESNSWFHSSLMGMIRFSAGAIVLAGLSWKNLGKVSRLEVWQGVGLGFFGGCGILLQMDGLAHTSASVSAFLTQTFCVWVPVVVALRDRKLPGKRLILATTMIVAGVAILTGFDPRTLHLGRGEWETLFSAVFFAGQIVWLERPIFKENNVNHFSMVMFAVMALLSSPIVLATMRTPLDIAQSYSHPAMYLLMGALVIFCTLLAFILMNKWQPFVPATEAAIIYGAEPVLASLMALFMPGLISLVAPIAYANERLTFHLVAGGTLIVVANLYLQAGWFRPQKKSVSPGEK